MAKNQVNMPSSTAGITTYYGEEKSKVQIAPMHVIALVIAVIVLLLLIHLVL
ncbi:MAG: preprotein translocase subunit Sec61beta [Candidatus Woesearchaeota archaeon]